MREKNTWKWVLAVAIFLFACFVAVFRPWFHWPLMVLATNPLAVTLVVFAGLAIHAGLNCHESLDRGISRIGWGLITSGLIMVALLAVYCCVSGGFRMKYLAASQNFVPRSSLPEIAQHRRLAYRIAEARAHDTMQNSTEKAFEFRPQLWNTKLSWVAARTPDGFRNINYGHMSGLATLDATKTNSTLVPVDQKMEVSEGVRVSDNIYWRLLKKRFFVTLPEVVYGTDEEGQVVSIVPIVAYRISLLPVPYFAGVWVIEPSGQSKYLNPNECLTNSAVLSAGRCFPEWLTRKIHESYAYRNGLRNKWFLHVDQPEITDPENDKNSQPYLLACKGGLRWETISDPWGKKEGIYKVFVTDAITGLTEVYQDAERSGLIGGPQSLQYLMSAYPDLNWARTSTGSDSTVKSGNMVAIEPLPDVVNGKLYWQSTLTTFEFRGVSQLFFLDPAAPRNVTACSTDKEADAFEAGLPFTPHRRKLVIGESKTGGVEKVRELLQEALKELPAQ